MFQSNHKSNTRSFETVFFRIIHKTPTEPLEGKLLFLFVVLTPSYESYIRTQ